MHVVAKVMRRLAVELLVFCEVPQTEWGGFVVVCLFVLRNDSLNWEVNHFRCTNRANKRLLSSRIRGKLTTAPSSSKNLKWRLDLLFVKCRTCPTLGGKKVSLSSKIILSSQKKVRDPSFKVSSLGQCALPIGVRLSLRFRCQLYEFLSGTTHFARFKDTLAKISATCSIPNATLYGKEIQ